MKMLNISPPMVIYVVTLFFLSFPPSTQCNARVGGGGGRLRAVPEERGGRGSVGERLARGKQLFPRKIKLQLNLNMFQRHKRGGKAGQRGKGWQGGSNFLKAGEGEAMF